MGYLGRSRPNKANDNEMMTCRAALIVMVYVCTLTGAVAQQGTVEQKNSGELQRRQEPAKKAEKAPVPSPVKAPEALETAKMPNANGAYQALRSRGASGPSFRVKGLVLKRDAGELQLNDGTVTLFNTVNGRVTGAVFEGQGVLHLEPPSAMERQQLKLVMKSEVLNQPFSTAVLEFTDGTAEELKKGSAGDAGTANATGPVEDAKTLFRKDLHYDLEERLLSDVVNPNPTHGGFFMADMKGPMFSKRLLYLWIQVERLA